MNFTNDDYDVATPIGARLRQTEGGHDWDASGQDEIDVHAGYGQFALGQHRCGSDDQSWCSKQPHICRVCDSTQIPKSDPMVATVGSRNVHDPQMRWDTELHGAISWWPARQDVAEATNLRQESFEHGCEPFCYQCSARLAWLLFVCMSKQVAIERSNCTHLLIHSVLPTACVRRSSSASCHTDLI